MVSPRKQSHHKCTPTKTIRRNTTTSSLDHIYSADPAMIDKFGKLDNSPTDHYPIYANMKIFAEKSKKPKKAKIILKRCFKSFSESRFRDDLVQKPWESLGLLSDVNSMVDKYERFINETLDMHAPIKRIQVHPHYKPGLSSQTNTLMAQRDAARRVFASAKGKERLFLTNKVKVSFSHAF